MKKRNEMPKRQTANHATAPMPMGRGPKRTLAAYAALVLTMTVGGIPVLAAGDPLSVINNLSTFIFSLIRAIGLILLGFGVVQVGLSLKSHDPSQRANGFLTLAGGVIITFARKSSTSSSVDPVSEKGAVTKTAPKGGVTNVG